MPRLCAGPGTDVAAPSAPVAGWLIDRYGVRWQITGAAVSEMLGSPDRAKAARAAAEFFKQQKVDLAGIEAAFDCN